MVQRAVIALALVAVLGLPPRPERAQRQAHERRAPEQPPAAAEER